MKRTHIHWLILIVFGVAAFWKYVLQRELDEFKDLATAVLTVVGASISTLGIIDDKKKESKRPARDTSIKNPVQPGRPFRLAPSFESGLYGGVAGGAAAGVVNALAQGGNPLLIFAFACVSGSLFGAATQLAILTFRHLVSERRLSPYAYNEVSGGLVGGGLAGAVLGALGGWLFGPLDAPAANPSMVVATTVFGGIAITIGALFYEYSGRLRDVLRSFLIAAVFSSIAAIVGVMLLGLLVTKNPFETSDLRQLTLAASAVGLVAGIGLGLQVGVTLWLYRSWNERRATDVGDQEHQGEQTRPSR